MKQRRIQWLAGVMAGAAMMMATATLAGDSTRAMAVLPEETNVVIRLNVAKLRQTAVYRQVVEFYAERYATKQEEIKAFSGIDPKTIRNLWLAAVKDGEGAVLVEADVDVGAIAAATDFHPASTELVLDGTRFAIEFPNDKQKMTMGAVLDNGLIAIGDPVYVEKVAAVCGGSAAGLSKEAVDRLAATRDETVLLQGVMLGIPPEGKNQDLAKTGLTGVNLKAGLDQTLEVNAEACFGVAQQAEAVKKILEGLLALQGLKPVAADQGGPFRRQFGAQLRRNLLDNLAMTCDGSKLRITSRIDAAVINAILANLPAEDKL